MSAVSEGSGFAKETEPVTVRAATYKDCGYFLRLRRDPVAARVSRHPAPTDEEHLRYWSQTSDYRYVAEVRGLPVGTLRISTDGMISIVVDPGYRGTGLGTQMLQAVLPIAKQQGFKRLHADVAAENIASQKAFTKAGWSPILFEVTT